MKKNLILLLLFISVGIQAQSLDKEYLIGTWTVDKVSVPEMDIETEQKAVFKQLKDDFEESIFTFHSDGTFNLELKKGVPEFMEELKFLNNTRWKFEEDNSSIFIGTEKDNYSLARILIMVKQETVFFLMEETPFLFTMKKK